MSGMFFKCNKLTNLNLSSFNTKNLINVKSIFCGCNNINTFNLSSFNKFNFNEMTEFY